MSKDKWYAFIWLLLVFTANSIPGNNLPNPNIPHLDKIVHFNEYFILTLLYLRATMNYKKLLQTRRYLISMVYVIPLLIIAAGDELHQKLIPFRHASVYDFLSDAFGISVAAVVFMITMMSQKKKNERNNYDL